MAKETSQSGNQLLIIHLSDLHFGASHRFQPNKTAGGDVSKESVPNLLESLTNDIKGFAETYSKVIVAVTGDLTCTASASEFKQARQFLEGLLGAEFFGQKIDKNSIFLVPGNHDINYEETDHELAWREFHSFYRDFYGDKSERKTEAAATENFFRIHDRTGDLGAVIVELNSSLQIQKNTVYQDRGFLSQNEIAMIDETLKKLDKDKLSESIKVALIHHHPVLIPSFAEAGKNYDAVTNAADLLTRLNNHKFHIVLHGHKHVPHSFSYDASCGWHKNESNPILIVAGGSASSRDLPKNPNAANSYNIIKIRSKSTSQNVRIHVETRMLVTHDKDHTTLLNKEWHWVTSKTLDRVLSPFIETNPDKSTYRPFDEKDLDKDSVAFRKSLYEDLRGNFPVVEIIPSVEPNQEFEAHVKVVGHKRRPEDVPKKVVWRAGNKFDVAECLVENDFEFKSVFKYYGGMVVHATLTFDDDKIESAYVYAHMKD